MFNILVWAQVHARTLARTTDAPRHGVFPPFVIGRGRGSVSRLLRLDRSLSSVLKSQRSLLGSRSCRTAMKPSGAPASKQQDGRWSVPTEAAAVSRATRLHVEGRLRSAVCRAVHGLGKLRIHCCVCFARPWSRRVSCSHAVNRGNHRVLHGLIG